MIKKTDKIVTAFAESASGPGWANTPLWVLVRDKSGRLFIECIQPDAQTNEMHTLYHVSHAVHKAMTDAVKAFVAQQPGEE